MAAKRWRHTSSIHRLEGSTLTWTVRKTARDAAQHGRRILILGDNMSVRCAASKGWATDFRLLSMCRQVTAYVRATFAFTFVGFGRVQPSHLRSLDSFGKQSCRWSQQTLHATYQVMLNASMEPEHRRRFLRPQPRSMEVRKPLPSPSSSSARAATSSPPRLSGHVVRGLALRPSSRAKLPPRESSRGKRPVMKPILKKYSTLQASDHDRLGLSYLTANKVRPETQLNYSHALHLLLGWLLLETLPTLSADEWDDALLEYLEFLHELGGSFGSASRTLAAVAWARPKLGSPLRSIWRQAMRALAGWKRLRPLSSRPPVPELGGFSLAMTMLDLGEPWMALGTIVTFETYMRPSELLSLRRFQVVTPLRDGEGVTACLTFVLHALESLTPGKTGEYDASIPLDLPRQKWLVPSLQVARAPGPLDGLLWPFTFEEYLKVSKMAPKLSLTDILQPTPYGLRHGGASHDRSVNARPLLEAQKRGGWKAFSSAPLRQARAARTAASEAALPCTSTSRSTAASRRTRLRQVFRDAIAKAARPQRRVFLELFAGEATSANTSRSWGTR